MENIKITADSTCDLNDELIKKYDFAISPLYIYLGETEERDHAGIDQKIYQYFRTTKKTPTTAALSVEDYKAFFAAHLPENGSLIHFNISREFSSTHEHAVEAAKFFKNVYVIDSRSLSTGTAISMLRAVKYREQGLSAASIVERINEEINRVQASFILDNLTYLHRGGRCSGTAKIFAAALHIKPQIVLTDGKMQPGKKFIGNFGMCVKKYVDYTFATNPNPDLSVCFITHTQMTDPKIVANIREQVLAHYPFEQVIETVAGGTVTSHCGENTIGILYGLK
ncbi:MAG: DegV family protein [Eubacteriales bacterium]|nr:DegV family protein [Eubacteriales bacterium]